VTGLVGLGVSCKRPQSKSFYAREGFVTVSLSWILMGLVGALPFVISGDIPNLLDAVFETVSGFSTTGSSILSDVESLSHASLLWRSFTHWIGGMGVLVFILSILPLAGAQNIYLMKAESPGPSVGKLVPKVKSTAASLYKIYVVMTLAELVALLCGGVNLFTAVNLSLSTAGTGGFGILNSSCGAYSTYIQIVITVFMILFGVNFSLYYLIVTKNGKKIFESEELRWYLGLIVGAIALITANVCSQYAHFGKALKDVAFTVAATITSTGFSAVDYGAWPEFSQTVLVILMFIGACAGSTGGGIKVSRVIIYLKSLVKMVEQYLHPKSIKIVKFEGKKVEHETIRTINNFLVAYMVLYLVSLLLVSLDNYDFATNFTAVGSSISNLGPGLNLVGPSGNYGIFSWHSKLVLIFDMIAGRLEIFPLLLLFAPSTYKK
jgi:trk system potassium uptake protein TrkH